MDHQRASPSDVLSLLEHGRVLRHQTLPSSNWTYRVEIGLDSGECAAIYKPRDGETPLWDFPPYTLYKRERLAYLVSEALGWGLVPPTVVRDGPFGIGSVQLFINAQRGRHYFNLMPAYKEEMARIALFDCIINNCDRKGGHCLLDREGRVWGIDHGLCFASGPKLRTVMWDLAEERIGDDTKKEIAVLCEDRRLREALSAELSQPEVEGFYRRVEVVLGAATIPISVFADPYRPLPWPAI